MAITGKVTVRELVMIQILVVEAVGALTKGEQQTGKSTHVDFNRHQNL